MKIKNLEIKQKKASKLVSYVLAGSLAVASLTGCCAKPDRNNILKGTILENSCVVTFADGTKDIAIAVADCNTKENNFHHYYSVTSGEYFSDEKCTASEVEHTPVHKYEITCEENITAYLTPEDIEKAISVGLEVNDISSIINRTLEQDKGTENVKTK